MKNLNALILLCLLSSIVSGQEANLTKKDSSDIFWRLEKLESQKEIIDIKSDLLEEKFQNKSDELFNQFDALRQQRELWMLVLSIVVIIVGAIGFWEFFVGIKQRVNNAIEEQLASVIEANKNHIKQLIQEQDRERRLKTESRILVLCTTEESKNELSTFFTNTGFGENAKYDRLRPILEIDESFQLIVFDDYYSHDSDGDIIKSHLEGLAKNTLAIIFTNRTLSFIEDYRDKVNLANSKFTLYNRIIETLKFKEFLK